MTRGLSPIAALGVLLAAGAASAAGAGCGGDVPCRVPLGQYRIILPEAGALRGALVFFHGHRSSAAAQMTDQSLVGTALARGLAFVAPDGRDGTWSHDGAPSQDRDETAFVDEILDDLETRFGIGPDRTVVGGFSQGASMAWYTVCRSGERVSAAVTFSGVFWSPLPAPEDCLGRPPPLIHFHGTADSVFHLAGRRIGSQWRQGDTFKSLAILRERAGCASDPPRSVTIAGIACMETEGCSRGPITACIHDGGHRADPAWLGAGLDRLTAGERSTVLPPTERLHQGDR